MAADNFPRCLDAILKHEGGYVDHPRDPGGATNLGITRATLARYRGKPASKDDVKKLTKAEAGEIYRKRFWAPICGDDLPPGIDFAVFDFAVNSGPSRAARYLQETLGVSGDGKIGPVTVAVARARNPAAVIPAFCRARLKFLRGLRTFSTFGKGWSRRVKETEALALKMAEGK